MTRCPCRAARRWSASAAGSLKTGPLRIVAVTGWGQDADKRGSHEAGFDLHLVKPVDVADLAKALSGRGAATLH